MVRCFMRLDSYSQVNGGVKVSLGLGLGEGLGVGVGGGG